MCVDVHGTDLEQQLVLGDPLDWFDQVITDRHPTADLMLDFLQTDRDWFIF